MNPLQLLWLVSLGISTVALWVMFALIVARLVSVRRARTASIARKQLAPLVMAGRTETIPADVDRRLLADLTVELIEMVRGDDREELVAGAARLGVPDELRRRLTGGNTRQRVLAAEALGRFPDPASAAALKAALDDRNPDVRLTAAIALARHGRAPPVSVLVDRLQLGTRENSLLIAGLFEEIARERPEEIKEMIRDESANGSVKAAAIEALAGTGDYALAPLISDLALATDSLSPALPRYLRALGKLQHPAGAPAVLAGLDSPSWEGRAAAAVAAGRIGLTAARERLAELLNDPQWAVRSAAAHALAALGAAGLDQLRSAAGGPLERAREAATLILAERGISA